MKERDRIPLRAAVDAVRIELGKGEAADLPAYLVDALKRADSAFWKDVDRRLIVRKLVGRYHEAGRPLTRDGAFADAAERLGVSAATVDRWYNATARQTHTRR